MRKILFALALLLVCCLSVSCGNSTTDDPAVTTVVTVTEITEALQENSTENLDPIEIIEMHRNEALDKATCSMDTSNAYYNYGDELKAFGDLCYNTLMEYELTEECLNIHSAEEFHKYLSDMKANHEKYMTDQHEYYFDAAATLWGGGSQVYIFKANHYYNMMKIWAEEMYSLTHIAGIDVNYPN